MNEQMQIVMEFMAGDGYTYWATSTIPIMYESCEAAMLDFEAKWKEAKANNEHHFHMFGLQFDMGDHQENGVFCSPEFLTVNEWFARGAQ